MMPEDDIHQPNDKLLKSTFSVPENARGFFENHPPKPLAAAIDWTSLSLEPCSFIDPQFASSESDLLFHVRLAQSDAFMYLLFEHQSTEAPPHGPAHALVHPSYLGAVCEASYAPGEAAREAVESVINPETLQRLHEGAMRAGSL